MSAPSAKVLSLPRKASREHRRQQLIDATIETLARRGYAQTTMTDVAVTAGVSHGLVNFHFETKERLLSETLLFLAEEYRQNWTAALAAAPPAPAAQLNALILADFNAQICTSSKLAAWCSFWGEAQSRPVYQEKCGANDAAYIRNLEEICARVIAEGGYPHPPARVARVLRVISEGVWLDMITGATTYAKEEALRTVFACAAAFFPRHFSEAGLIA
jgi:TetR/AcrR family transcriptional repressor of bet genes